MLLSILTLHTKISLLHVRPWKSGLRPPSIADLGSLKTIMMNDAILTSRVGRQWRCGAVDHPARGHRRARFNTSICGFWACCTNGKPYVSNHNPSPGSKACSRRASRFETTQDRARNLLCEQGLLHRACEKHQSAAISNASMFLYAVAF